MSLLRGNLTSYGPYYVLFDTRLKGTVVLIARWLITIASGVLLPGS